MQMTLTRMELKKICILHIFPSHLLLWF